MSVKHTDVLCFHLANVVSTGCCDWLVDQLLTYNTAEGILHSRQEPCLQTSEKRVKIRGG